jgi:hypothetical protein
MKFTEKAIVPFVLFLTGLIVVSIQLLSSGVTGETDSITHYQIARYAFKYPEYFLNHWGKPLFTILASPLSQFGYIGTVSFNILCGLVTAWFVFRVAKRLEYRYAWLAIVFTVFMPGYLFIMYSGLTEILFSLVLVISIYLFVSERFIWSAIVISLIPFSRTEGVMYLALFFPVFIWIKQYKALPFLLTGFILFGLIGLPYYHDFFWFFTKMPYSTSSSALYGSGSFWSYFREMDYYMAYPLLILSVLGLVFISLNFKSGFKNLRDIKFVTLYFLILPAFFGFILAQSFLWWKGLGVLASTRFMACVLPLSAIVAVTGFEWVMEKAKANKAIYYVLGTFIIALVVYKPFTYNQIPMKTGINFAVMEQLAAWLKASPYSKHKAMYSDPMFPFYMDMDPFDQNQCFKVYDYQNTDPASLLKHGQLMVWDAQFAGYEGHLPFDSLMKNSNLRLLNMFTPMESFTIIGGEKYKIALFIKEPKDTAQAVYKQLYFNDFESNLPEDQSKNTTNKFSKSGKNSILLSPENIYSPAIEGKLQNLPGISNVSFRASVRILNPSTSEKGQIILALSIEDQQHKVYRYLVAKDTDVKSEPGKWFQLSLTDMVDRNNPVDGNYKVYVWYTGKGKIYVDDLKLEYMKVGE